MTDFESKYAMNVDVACYLLTRMTHTVDLRTCRLALIADPDVAGQVYERFGETWDIVIADVRRQLEFETLIPQDLFE